MSFIRFGSLKVKLQSFIGDVSVLKVCKLNTNNAILTSVLGGKLMLNAHTFTCPWLFIHLLLYFSIESKIIQAYKLLN